MTKIYKSKEDYDSLPAKKKAQAGSNYLTILKKIKPNPESPQISLRKTASLFMSGKKKAPEKKIGIAQIRVFKGGALEFDDRGA
jgi:hypothetical protein